jgi:hypothetical protein
MGYSGRTGRRPAEYASRNSHTNIINDKTVQGFLEGCHLPPKNEDVSISSSLVEKINKCPNPIKHIIAIDGGYTEVPVRKEFPSARIAFFQFGGLFFNISDLENISSQPFIDPEDMEKLKRLERFKLTIPTKNITFSTNPTLTHSVRNAIHNFFIEKRDPSCFAETLKWLIYQEFKSNPETSWTLSQCPYCQARSIELERNKIKKDFTLQCPSCAKTLYLTDVLRLHEAIDDELGAGGILGYLMVTLEQILLVHFLKLILEIKPNLLHEFLFIKDGPLAFFGQTANLHKPMRFLVQFLFSNHNLYLVGLEKSGAFVEHAMEIQNKLEPSSVLILDNDYIYKYIIPGKADPEQPYGKTTYYSNKIIYKTENGNVYVATLPTSTILIHPQRKDFRGLDIICENLTRLKCDMYDSSLFPVALANKLVSLSNHPSATILGKFAKSKIYE